MRTVSALALPAFLTALGFSTLPGCNGELEEPHVLPAEVIVLGEASPLGTLERPAVTFKHDVHSEALAGEGCATCHPRDAEGRLSPRFARQEELGDRTALMNRYHERCMGCHTERARRSDKTGPVTCGECHRRRPESSSARQEMRWDYSRHAAHARAADGKCDGCHHVKDPATGQPVYRKGAEEGCRSCHGAGRAKLTHRQAAHKSCIACHLARAGEKKRTGPHTCTGCHGPRPAPAAGGATPRLQRGQPDHKLIRVAGAKGTGVPFDHRAHEPRASFCSSCHHQTLAACATCHTLPGSSRGGGVTLAAAYHHATSTRSCVGCHAQATAQKDCAGCHAVPGGAARGKACRRCHLEGAPSSSPTTVALPALPEPSETFPETVTIGSLAREYKPALVAHRKIVAHLDRAVRQSKLARQFHGTVETLCAGCHHHSPAGARPPACKSCHGATADPRRDRPALQAAYHRQCIGCHQQMGITKVGCPDCHAREERQ